MQMGATVRAYSRSPEPEDLPLAQLPQDLRQGKVDIVLHLAWSVVPAEAELHFFDEIHTATKRDYLARVLTGKKTEHSLLARKFGQEYWDGSRDTGYVGYQYDGRWRALAEKILNSFHRQALNIAR